MSSIPPTVHSASSETTTANDLSSDVSTVAVVPYNENDVGHREVKDFLDKCKLSQYLSVFINEGFDSLKSLCEVSEDDMIVMNVKRGHRRLIQREIATLKGIPRHHPLWISFTASTSTFNTIDPRIGQLRLVQRPPGPVWANTGNGSGGDGNTSSSSGGSSHSRSLDFSSESVASSYTSLTTPPKKSSSATNADSSSSGSPSKRHIQPPSSQTQTTVPAQVSQAVQHQQPERGGGQSAESSQATSTTDSTNTAAAAAAAAAATSAGTAAAQQPVSAVENVPGTNKLSGSSNDDEDDDEEDSISSSTRPNATTTMTMMPPKRKYKKRPKADKNAPVKPPSAYIMFSNDIRAQLKDQNLSFAQLAKIVGERWKHLSRKDKLSYETAAVVAKDHYHAALEQYRQTPEYRRHQEYLREFKSKQEADHRLLAGSARKRSKAGSPSSGSMADCSSNGNNNGNGSSGSSGSADSYDGNGNDGNEISDSSNRNNKVQVTEDRRNKGKSRMAPPRHSTGSLPTVSQYRESDPSPTITTESGAATMHQQQQSSETTSSSAMNTESQYSYPSSTRDEAAGGGECDFIYYFGPDVSGHFISTAFPEMLSPIAGSAPAAATTVIAKIPGTNYTHQGDWHQQQQQAQDDGDEHADNNNNNNYENDGNTADSSQVSYAAASAASGMDSSSMNMYTGPAVYYDSMVRQLHSETPPPPYTTIPSVRSLSPGTEAAVERQTGHSEKKAKVYSHSQQ